MLDSCHSKHGEAGLVLSTYYEDGTCQTDLAAIEHIRHFSFRLVYCLCVANCSFTASKGLHGDTMLLFSMKLAMRNLVNVAHLQVPRTRKDRFVVLPRNCVSKA